MRGADDTGNTEGGHEANGADGQLCALQDCLVAKDVEFEAAAAEIHNAIGRRFGAESGDGRFTAEAGFFFGTNDFEADTGGLLDAMDERTGVTRFAGGAGGDGTIFGDTVFVHDFLEMDECFYTFFQQVFTEAMTKENAFAEAQGIALVDKRFDVEGGIGAGDGEADCVGAGVDGGDVDRL